MAQRSATSRAGGSVDDRRRNLWPLPGGVDGYATSVQQMLLLAKDRPSRGVFHQRVFDLFPQVESESTVRGYVGVLVALGFITRDSDKRMTLTPDGTKFARTADLRILRDALVGRVVGAREVLEAVNDHSMAYPELQRLLDGQGVAWGNQMALRYRVWWLRAAGALDAKRVARADWLTVTRAGKALLQA